MDFELNGTRRGTRVTDMHVENVTTLFFRTQLSGAHYV